MNIIKCWKRKRNRTSEERRLLAKNVVSVANGNRKGNQIFFLRIWQTFLLDAHIVANVQRISLNGRNEILESALNRNSLDYWSRKVHCKCKDSFVSRHPESQHVGKIYDVSWAIDYILKSICFGFARTFWLSPKSWLNFLSKFLNFILEKSPQSNSASTSESWRKESKPINKEFVERDQWACSSTT